jgi:glycosyltransferase involved in cell wall biosynthesis
MIRPRTPRRQPALTVSVLNALRSRLGEAIDIVTFGCAVNDLQALPGGSSLRCDHRGILPRTAVADVLRCSDVFVDLSIYQAFGRTALEAMACGCVPVMPSVGGGREFIRPGINGVLVDTGAAEPFTSVAMDMAQDPQGRARMRSAGLETAARYSAPRAAVSEYVVLAEAVGRTALAASGSSPTG